jgi:subtilisin family serine protease
VISLRPAFSAAFAETGLAPLVPLDPIDGITRDWAWEGSSGEGVKVAVVDSGVDATHPDVGPIQGYLAVREGQDGTLVYDTEPHDDCYGHATACAGVIRSLAPACELYSIKVFESGLSGSALVLGGALRWAIDNGIQVCNLSLGTTNREFFGVLHELADLAYFRNIPLVTAANNLPVPSFPSVYASVISVASHAIQDPYTFYYNPKPPVEFGALGIDVRLAWRNHKYLTATGNSYAAPHITGLVCKILGKHPGLTVFQLKTILRALANNVHRSQIETSPRPLGDGLATPGKSTA